MCNYLAHKAFRAEKFVGAVVEYAVVAVVMVVLYDLYVRDLIFVHTTERHPREALSKPSTIGSLRRYLARFAVASLSLR